MEKEIPPHSPVWSTNTKLVIGLTIVAVATALVIYFRAIIGPLLLALILSFILHPVANKLSSTTRLNWRMSVNLVFLVVLLILGGLITWSGFAVIQQFQSLILFVQNFIEVTLPQMVADLSRNVYLIGPFAIDLTQYDLQALSQQVLGILQPIVARSATLISTLATSAAVAFGWLLFILVISYFLLAESKRVPLELIRIEVPGYDQDIRRLAVELQKIWYAYLRGQMMIFMFAVVLNLILLSTIGLRFALGIAILAGIAKFIPYLGPFTVLIIGGVVAFFQPTNIFGLEPWQYLVLTLISIFVLDQSFDNLAVPRLLGRVLNLHPAAILVTALIAFNLIGIVGLIVAAPVLATLKLLGRYTIRMLLDLDPWEERSEPPPPMEFPWVKLRRITQTWYQSLQKGKESN
jgi:predicted PurR-regulated permease PerM